MGFFDRFKDQKDEFDPLKDLELSKLKVGYFLDYDLKTWEVTAYNRYDFGDGYFSDEWELTSGREKWYLECYEDDEIEWALCKKIPIGMIEGDVRNQIIENEDPPSEVNCKGKTYYLDESGSAYLQEGGSGEKKGFIFWDFIDEEDENFLTIEQWDETEFEAAMGHYVKEFQFSNILPGIKE
jgi:hypothetical protein